MSVVVPAIPVNFFVQQGNAEVFLLWDIVAGITSYSVKRSTDGITYSVIASPTVNNYLDTSVSPNTLYYYQVAATNADGTSSYTSPQAIIPTNTGNLSLAELRTLAQLRADRLNSQFCTLPEWNSFINQSYFELYDLLIQKYGDDYFIADPLSITLTSAQGYDLPNGTNNSGAAPFYKLVGVDLALNSASNAWITLSRYNFVDRNTYIYPQLPANYLGQGALQYRLVGSQIQFIPFPSSGSVVRLWYIPRMTQLLQETDVCDGVSGWTEYIIVDAAIKALQKEESDVSVLMAQKQALIARIEAAAENRDAGMPMTISDTRNVTGNGISNYGGFNGPIGGY